MKCYTGNHDGRRRGLIVTTSWAKAAFAGRTTPGQMKPYFQAHPGVPPGIAEEFAEQGMEIVPGVFYVRPYGRSGIGRGELWRRLDDPTPTPPDAGESK